MRILISAALFCLGAFLSGCTQTAGSSEITNFANYAQLEKGKSNKRDVYSAFGQPHDVTSTTSGAKWTYYYVKAEMSGGSYIPILGILIGGLDMDGTRTSFNFNE